MNATSNNAAPRGLRGWWASPPRSGLARWLAPWEYRQLRAWAAIRIAAGIVFAGLGVYVISVTSPGAWAFFGAYLLAVGVGCLALAFWELNIANSASAQT
jgi:hypothetical protein